MKVSALIRLIPSRPLDSTIAKLIAATFETIYSAHSSALVIVFQEKPPTLLVIASDLASKSQVVGEIDHTLFGGGSEHGRGSAPKAKLRSKSLPLRRRAL